MPRRPRLATGGIIFHVLNRAARQLPIFEAPGDYDAFLGILREAQERLPLTLFAFCIMPNHWHLLARPRSDRELSHFMAWLTTTHAQRWRAHRATRGGGSVYQGRFKALPVQDDEHFLTVCRYVERNALRAGLVARAEQWPWSSLCSVRRTCEVPLLSPWPIVKPQRWVELVNLPEPPGRLADIRERVRRGAAFGDPQWAARLGAAGSGRARRGRPRRR